MEIPIYKGHPFALSRSQNKQNYYSRTSNNFSRKARAYVFDRDGHKCLKCDSTDTLQADHIISIYTGFKNGIELSAINNVDNIQTLCRSCNAGKSPESRMDYREKTNG